MMNIELLNKQAQESLHFFESELFKNVQMSGLFSDSKTFADAMPKASYVEILQSYHNEKIDITTFNLKNFIEGYFDIIKYEEVRSETVKTSIEQHIDSLWTV